MSETSFQNSSDDEYLIEAIEEAAQVARTGKHRFWLLSAMCTLAIIMITAMFIQQMNNLESLVETSLSRLEVQSQKLQVLEDGNIALTSTMIELKDTVFSLTNLNFDNLNEETRDSLGIQIADQVSARTGTNLGGRISEVEQEFLKQFSESENYADDGPNSAADAYLQASSQLSRGNNQAAKELFVLALEGFDEPYPAAYIGLGRAYFADNQFSSATEAFKNASVADGSAEAFTWLCTAQGRIGLAERRQDQAQLDAALANCSLAIQRESDYWWPYHVRGFTHLYMGNFKESVADWRAAGSRRNDPKYSLENIGLAYLWSEDWQQAFDYTTEFNTEYTDNSSWNWFVRAVAADKLALDDSKSIFENWEEMRTPEDVDDLKDFIPPGLYGYLE